MTEDQQNEITRLTAFIKAMEELGEVKLEMERVRIEEEGKYDNALTFGLGNKKVVFPSMVAVMTTTGIQKEKELLEAAIKAFTVPQIVKAKARIVNILG